MPANCWQTPSCRSWPMRRCSRLLISRISRSRRLRSVMSRAMPSTSTNCPFCLISRVLISNFTRWPEGPAKSHSTVGSSAPLSTCSSHWRAARLLFLDHQFHNVPRKNPFAATLQQAFAGFVDGRDPALQIMRVNHVVGVLEQIQVTLLQRGFHLQFLADDFRLASDLAAQQTHPRQSRRNHQHHASQQHECVAGSPPRRGLQQLNVIRLAQQQAKGFGLMRFSAFDGAHSRQAKQASRLQSRNLRAPGLGFQDAP